MGGYIKSYMGQTEQDAAALTAAEISQRVFERSGDLKPTSRISAHAQAFAGMNNCYLSQNGINAVITGITLDAGDDTGLVQVSANLERLFPDVVPDIVVTEGEYAGIRAFTR